MGLLDRDIVEARESNPAGDLSLPDRRHPLENYDSKSTISSDYLFTLWNPNSGDYEDYQYGALVDAGILNPGIRKSALTGSEASVEAFFGATQNNLLDYYGYTGGGGGGGGGGAGAVYVKPDERLVRDAVKAKLALWVGRADEGLVDEYTALYMSEAERAFNNRESEQIDPMASVQERIREQSDYKAIHQLRPDAVSEDEWVSSRQGALMRAGVTPTTATELGISQAQIGASEAATATAGSTAHFAQSGQQLDELKNRMRNAAYGVLSVA